MVFDGLSKQLNDYLEFKIQNQQLAEKKFNITIWLFPLETCDCCPLQLSQNSNGYYVNIVEKELGLIYLSRVIDYFSSSNWVSFVCQEPKKFQKIAFRTIDNKISSHVPIRPYDFYEQRITTVFEIDALKIDYTNDSLILKIDGEPFDININFNKVSVIPKKLNNYYFIADDDSIYVIKDKMILNSFKRPLNQSRYSKFEVYRKWVNYFDGDTPVISYSIASNQFYRVERK